MQKWLQEQSYAVQSKSLCAIKLLTCRERAGLSSGFEETKQAACLVTWLYDEQLVTHIKISHSDFQHACFSLLTYASLPALPKTCFSNIIF